MPKKIDNWGDAAANTAWSKRIAPAPGDLRIVQAFVNTYDKDAGTDELTSPQALANWFTRWRLVDGKLQLSKADFKRALDVRSTLRGVIWLNWGKPGPQEMVERLDRLAAGASFRIRFGGVGAARFEAQDEGLDGALGALFKIIQQSQTEGTWDRLKTCCSDACSRTFYDFSTNRSSKWCIKSICGDRINTQPPPPSALLLSLRSCDAQPKCGRRSRWTSSHGVDR